MKLHYRILITLTLCLGIVVSASAQVHAYSLGLRGGVATWLVDGGGLIVSPGYAASIDMGYSFRWIVGHAEVGAKTGVNMLLSESAVSKANYEEYFTNIDYLGDRMDYSIAAQGIKQRNLHIQCEIPLMLSVKVGKWVFDAGAKVAVPLYTQRRQDINKADITAYFVDYEVPITNKIVTGKAQQYNPLHQKGPGDLPLCNVLVGAQVGQEWKVKGQHYLGVQVYADYDVWNSYSHTLTATRLMDVTPIMDPEDPFPDVTCQYLTDVYPTSLRFLNCGLKIYYLFDQGYAKYKGRKWSNKCHCYIF